MTHILAIDQGTTSTRAILFDETLTAVASAQEEFDQHYPNSGWVEHDPSDLWSTTAATCRAAIEKAGAGTDDIAAIGITNQRETTLVWNKKTGKPVFNAIVWQDRRTSEVCKALKADGFEEVVTDRTGLLLDPYFSGTKLAWILDNVDGGRARAEAGELVFGTVDTWLVWNLTGAASTSPTPPTLHARCFTTSARAAGPRPSATRWASRCRCCPRSRIAPPISVRPAPICSG